MHPESLYPKTAQVLEKLSELTFITETFYLAGGTSLALQLGHRKSVDLDFFTKDFPKKELLLQELRQFNPEIIQEAEGTLDVYIDEVKVSFLDYDYPNLENFADYQGVKLASVLDIACMKLSAISSRGSKKDFVDLYFIFQKVPLGSLLSAFEEKFSDVNYQDMHLMKALVYFEDAEQDPDPDYLTKITWEEVKRVITAEVQRVFV